MSGEATRRYLERKYAEIEAMPKMPCECGCGTMIPPVNKRLEPARFAHGHNGAGIATRYQPGHGESPETKAKRIRRGEEHWAHGTRLPGAQVVKRAETRRRKYGGRYTSTDARGWRHSDDTRRKMSAAKTGEKHPAWRGGISLLPYGPGFTRALKRAIKERDKYTCQRCGVTAAECPHPLAVHHVDGDKRNNDPTNLVTLCPSCNGYFVHHMDESLAMFAIH